MAENLLKLRCDCEDINCKLSLVVTPLNSISVISGVDNWVCGLHLSISDTEKLIKKLKDNIKRAKEMEIEAERILHKVSLLRDNNEKNNL